jgi:hypothetical protein
MTCRLHVARLTAIALAACISVAGGCTARDAAHVSDDTDAPQDVVETAKQVVAAMKARNGAGLAEFVHRGRGVRFSPYAFVDVSSDRVLSHSDVRRLWEDGSVYSWGHADGTGDPIMLTPAGYVERFVMDRDFTAATSVTVNDYQVRGTTTSNAAAVYPNGTSVEFFLEPLEGPGDPAFEWRALRLVFENQAGSWQLIAVIHDEWTT